MSVKHHMPRQDPTVKQVDEAVFVGEDPVTHKPNRRTRFSVFVVLSLIIAVVDALFVYVNYVFSQQAYLAEFEDQREIFAQAFNSQVENTTDNLILVANLFAEDPQVQQLFLAGKKALLEEGGGRGGERTAKLRAELHARVAPVWSKAIENMNARQLHFHLGPGSLSYLRVHRPKKFGDRMDNLRYIIIDTNDDHQTRTGFETGRVYSGLRGVVPVWADDPVSKERVYVGALEAGTSFSNILNGIDEHMHLGSAVLLTKAHVQSTMWADFIRDKFGEGVPGCNCVIDEHSRQDAQSKIEVLVARHGALANLNGVYLIDEVQQSTAYFIVPLFDYIGTKNQSSEAVGAVVFWRDVSGARASLAHEQRFNIVYAVLAFLFIEFLLVIAFRQHRAYLVHQVDEATRRLHEAQRIAHIGNWDLDLQSGQEYLSPEFQTIFDSPRTGIGSRYDSQRPYIDDQDLEHADNVHQHAMSQQHSMDLVFRVQIDDNTVKYVRKRGQTLVDNDGKPSRCFGTVQDITELMRAQERLSLLASVFTHSHEGVMITDPNSMIIDVNDAFCWITGYPRDEALGKSSSMLNSGLHKPDFFKDLWQDLVKQGYWAGEVVNRRKDGDLFTELLTISAVRDDHGNIQHYVALFSDITEQKQRHREQLEHLVNFDALTNLPNRTLMLDRLRKVMAQTGRQRNSLLVVYVDIDSFKQINEIQGQKAGDRLLVKLAQRLVNSQREGDTVARVGGDEFVLILSSLQDDSTVNVLLDRLLRVIASEINVNGKAVQISASIGATMYPQQQDVSADELVRQADQAMFTAKQQGKNRFYLFDPEHDQNIRGRHETIERIGAAIEADEFILFYQPQVNMRSGQVIGVEALIRWQHPAKGLLLPGTFLPIIDNHPITLDLDVWVLNQALSQMEQWASLGHEFNVSVNLSGDMVQSVETPQRIRAMLAEHPKANPRQLVIEILETSALEDINSVIQVMEECEALGIRFAVDDFGTGYSSLTYLKRLPATELKIDQSFVRGMLQDPADLEILNSVLNMARAFRRFAVAEGVETLEHAELLLKLGCDIAQGYAIARPMPPEQLANWIQTWKPEPCWAQQREVRRDELPLLIASIENRSWINQIELCLKNRNDLDPMLKRHEQNFGEWLYSANGYNYSCHPAFESVLLAHRDLHQFAQRCSPTDKVRPQQETAARLSELGELSTKLLNSLEQLRDEVAQSVAGSSP